MVSLAKCVSTITRTVRGVPTGHLHDKGCSYDLTRPGAPLDAWHYYYVFNEKLTDHLTGPIEGPLLSIFIYPLFFMFNISEKGIGL